MLANVDFIFPKPILENIFLYLPTTNLVSTAVACKLFNKTITESKPIQKKITDWLVYQYIELKIPLSLSEKEELPAIPNFEQVRQWRDSHKKNPINSIVPLSLIPFNEICSQKVQSSVVTLSTREVKLLVTRGYSLLIWYTALFQKKTGLLQLLFQLHNSAVLGSLTIEDFTFAFKGFIRGCGSQIPRSRSVRFLMKDVHPHIKTIEKKIVHEWRVPTSNGHPCKGKNLCICLGGFKDIEIELLDSLLKKGVELTDKDFKTLIKRCLDSQLKSFISCLIENQSLTLKKENFLIIHNRFSYEWLQQSYQFLLEAGFPIHYDYLYAKEGFKRPNDHEQWEKKEILLLISAGLKIYDQDLLDLVSKGGAHSASIVDSFIEAGAYHRETVDHFMNCLIQIINKALTRDSIKIDYINTLELLIETSGINQHKIDEYKNQIQQITLQRPKWDKPLLEICKVLNRADKIFKTEKLSRGLQALVSPQDLEKLIKNDEEIVLKAHHFSYALRFHYPVKIIQFLIDKNIPVKEFHLSVALQWGCDIEIIQLLIKQTKPSILHLNCALKHYCEKGIIQLLLEYWRKNGIIFLDYQLANVLHNAIEWSSSDEILQLLIHYGAKLDQKHQRHLLEKQRTFKFLITQEHLPKST